MALTVGKTCIQPMGSIPATSYELSRRVLLRLEYVSHLQRRSERNPLVLSGPPSVRWDVSANPTKHVVV